MNFCRLLLSSHDSLCQWAISFFLFTFTCRLFNKTWLDSQHVVWTVLELLIKVISQGVLELFFMLGWSEQIISINSSGLFLLVLSLTTEELMLVLMCRLFSLNFDSTLFFMLTIITSNEFSGTCFGHT